MARPQSFIQWVKSKHGSAWEKATSSSDKTEVITSVQFFLNNTPKLPAYYNLLANLTLLEYQGCDLTDIKEVYHWEEANEALVEAKKLYKYDGDDEIVKGLAERLCQTHAASAYAKHGKKKEAWLAECAPFAAMPGRSPPLDWMLPGNERGSRS